MRKVDYFKPLIGTRYGSNGFKEAVDKLSERLGKKLTYDIIEAKTPKECEIDDPLKQYYPKERVLLLRSEDGKIEAIYRADQPYEDDSYRGKYPNGNIDYIIPRYPAAKEYDVSLTAAMLYYTSVSAYRYLEVISSTFPTPAEDRRNMTDDAPIANTMYLIRRKLELDKHFEKNDSDSPQVAKQKLDCQRFANDLLRQISKITIRLARPFIETTIKKTADKALTSAKDDIERRIAEERPIMGANDDMSLTLRYLTLSLKLIIQDYHKYYGQEYDKNEHKENFEEFQSFNQYLMCAGKFVNTPSYGLIAEPDEKELKEFIGILPEIHGEVSKLGALLGISITNKKAPTKEKPTEEISEKRLNYFGQFMVANRANKITRACYHADLCLKTIKDHLVQNDENLIDALDSSTHAAKGKISTSMGSKQYTTRLEEYEAETTKLKKLGKDAELPQQIKNAINTFVTELDSMTETKRRRGTSAHNIDKAAKSATPTRKEPAQTAPLEWAATTAQLTQVHSGINEFSYSIKISSEDITPQR